MRCIGTLEFIDEFQQNCHRTQRNLGAAQNPKKCPRIKAHSPSSASLDDPDSDKENASPIVTPSRKRNRRGSIVEETKILKPLSTNKSLAISIKESERAIAEMSANKSERNVPRSAKTECSPGAKARRDGGPKSELSETKIAENTPFASLEADQSERRTRGRASARGVPKRSRNEAGTTANSPNGKGFGAVVKLEKSERSEDSSKSKELVWMSNERVALPEAEKPKSSRVEAPPHDECPIAGDEAGKRVEKSPESSGSRATTIDVESREISSTEVRRKSVVEITEPKGVETKETEELGVKKNVEEEEEGAERKEKKELGVPRCVGKKYIEGEEEEAAERKETKELRVPRSVGKKYIEEEEAAAEAKELRVPRSIGKKYVEEEEEEAAERKKTKELRVPRSAGKKYVEEEEEAAETKETKEPRVPRSEGKKYVEEEEEAAETKETKELRHPRSVAKKYVEEEEETADEEEEEEEERKKFGKISDLITDEQKEAIEKFYTVDMSVVDEEVVGGKIVFLEKKSFGCKICRASYPRQDKCQVHIWGHLGMKPYRCNACDFSTVTVSNIRCHIRKSHLKIKPYACELCEKRYVTAFLLEEHTNTHTGSRPYSCDHCKFTSASRQVLSYHKSTHKPVKDITCHVCGKEFYSKGRMRAHMVIHNKDKAANMCKLCSIYLCNSEALERHQANVHSQDYVCNVCEKRCKSKKALNNHQNVHSAAKYKCNLCSNVYKSSHILKEHILKHKGIRKYKCNVCGKDFAQQSHLAAHMAVHSEKRFLCPGCNRPFNRHDNMKMHTKRCDAFLANPELSTLLAIRRSRSKPDAKPQRSADLESGTSDEPESPETKKLEKLRSQLENSVGSKSERQFELFAVGGSSDEQVEIKDLTTIIGGTVVIPCS